nr:probable E3 ubiquitin-protein ligase RHB1A [Ipomoea batatas]
MGGCCCCCASKGGELNSSSPFYHNWIFKIFSLQYPRVSEERQPLSHHGSTALVLSTGLLVDTNLDTSSPDTYRPPPTPRPYETHVGRPRTPPGNQDGHKNEAAAQTKETETCEEANSGNGTEIADTATKGSDAKVQDNIELTAQKEVVDELEKSGELKKSNEPIVPSLQEEEDVCPTCLEEYDEENPKIITQCEHHFHLSCILEWMERSDTCPVCDQEMVFSA